MNERLALYGWIERHRLGVPQARSLFALAGLGTEPPAVQRRFWIVVAVLAAALGGLGVILWLAANWDGFGRLGRFALLQGALVVMALGAALQARPRPPLGLMALLCIGALFAYFGQTYQTGADPWQLFALWACLALPLCLAVRSDVLWAPWALVVAAAISLWLHAHTGHRWRIEASELDVFLLAWLASVLLVAALSPAAEGATGAGAWALRTAGTCSVVIVTLAGIGGLFHPQVAPHYVLALAVLAGAAAVLAFTRWFEVYLLSAVALALDALLVAGLGRWLFDRSTGDPLGRTLLLGLLAAGLLAATVSAVLRVVKRHGPG